MDALELARQRAYELHLKAVQAGENPWSPYDFAVAEATLRGIKVERCAKGATVLEDGRALLDPAFPAIFHETCSTPFEEAFLVAHELGHAELGDGEEPPQPATAVDPTRSAEAAPVGMDRVVDYSRRQRREVQMDLFAREFLLPRPVARTLHLEHGLTCTAIAVKLGAPVEVVAQQLLDALLLPPVEPVVEQSPPALPPNCKQRKAAAHRGKAFLLQAGPGTGKTRTLVARVEGLLDEGVDPRRVLLLTFSNKAASEMAERLARSRPKEAAALWIGTFHGFGLDILRRFNDQCGLPPDPRLIDRTEAVELLENEFPRLGLTHYRDLFDPSQVIADLLAAISRAKDEVVDAPTYLGLAQAMAVRAPKSVESERALEVAKVYSAYEQLKQQAGRVDFGDLVMKPVQLLEANDALREQLQQAYDHVLVDEYQDVNRSSVRLLAALKPVGGNLWVVGDAKQSIYRFRGASSFNIERFGREDFPGGLTDFLDSNYRSTPEIVHTFSCFAQNMAASKYHHALTSERPASAVLPEIRTVTEGTLLSSALAECITQMRQSGIRYRDQAVLCRGNDKLADTGQELERLGIPVLFLGSLFERQEVKDLVAVLSLLVDRRAMGLLRTACTADFAMSLDDAVRVFEHLRTSEAEAGGWVSGTPGISASGAASLAKLKAALAGFDATSNPWTVLTAVLLDRTPWAADIARSSSVADQARGIAIWQFMNFVRTQPAGRGLPITRLMDRMRRLLRLRDERDLRQLPSAAQGVDAVRLMTIHGAKGLEFPVVHLAGVNHDTLPGNFRPEKVPPPTGMIVGGRGTPEEVARAAHGAEQECLFYVAMSRAKERLYFYAATEKRGGTKRKLSEYLGRLGQISTQHISPAIALPPEPEDAALLVAFTGPVRFKAEAIALYDSCSRRFLYTHLLQVGGRRRSSAFVQMHGAVRTVFQALVASGNAPAASWETLLEEQLVLHDLQDHGYVDDYRKIAQSMLRYFLASRSGAVVEPPTALLIAIGAEQIEVTPDEVLVRDGIRTLRRVKTGHVRASDEKDVAAAGFLMAAQRAFPGARVELVYLADAEAKQLSLTPAALGKHEQGLKAMLAGIRAGRFPAVRSEFTCPGCPAFFVCGATPPGTLRKTF